MIELLLSFVCLFVLSLLVLLLRSFEFLSLPELKRQARKGHRLARAVYAVRGAYGSDVFILLWGLIGLVSSGMVLLLESKLWVGLTLLIAIPVTVLVHGILPWSKYPRPSLGLAASFSPAIMLVLRVLSPIFRLLEKATGSWIIRSDIKQIHSKEELLDALKQTQIKDDPFSKDELSIAIHALTFGDKKITEVMTPLSVVNQLDTTDELSPVALGELHDSGYSRFPVYDRLKKQYVGVLYAKDLELLHTNKTVADVMKKEVFYVNEFSQLDSVLNAFIKTKHHLFMVVNEFEEVVGVVTIEDVIEEVLGKEVIDEFDQYADMRAVARELAEKRARAREERSTQ